MQQEAHLDLIYNIEECELENKYELENEYEFENELEIEY